MTIGPTPIPRIGCRRVSPPSGLLALQWRREDLAVVHSFRRSAHKLCLAGRVPRLPVNLGATTLHLDPWQDASPYDMPLPSHECRNSAAQWLHDRFLMLGSAGRAGSHLGCGGGGGGAKAEGEKEEYLPMELFAVQGFLAGVHPLHEQCPQPRLCQISGATFLSLLTPPPPPPGAV